MSKKFITIVFIVFFSIMMWVFISLSGDYFYTVKLPITFSDIPEGYAVSNYSDEDVSISLKGQGWQLAQLTLGSTPEFIINVDRSPGTHTIPLRNALDQNRWLSSAVQINEFSPDEIKYKIEELAEKKVPVKSNITLEFGEGYGLVADTKVIPESVLVHGPKSLVESLDFVQTESKVVTSVDKDLTETVNIEPISNVEYDIDKVKLEYDVQKIVDKEFHNISVEIQNVPPSKKLTVYPEQISVILKGGINLLGKLNPDEIKVSINFDQAIKDTLGYLVPNVIVPQFTELVDTKPNKLEYIIQQL